MAEDKNTPEASTPGVEDNKSSETASGDDEVFSLDDIDSLLEENDPEFVAGLDEISKDEDLKTVDVDEGVEVEPEESAKPSPWTKVKQLISLKSEKLKSLLSKRWPRMKDRYVIVRSQIPKVFQYTKAKGLTLWSTTKVFLIRLKTELPERKNYLVKALKDRKTKIIQKIKSTSRWSMAAFLGLALFTVGLAFLTHLTFTKGWIHPWIQKLPGSMAEIATEVIELGDKEPLKKLYHRFPDEEYIVLLDKMVVNLKASRSSQNRPMGYFEFYVRLNSQETAVEVKDRQREVMDLFGRTLEDHTYDELKSKLGIRRFKKEAINHLNYILNQGRASEIFLKSMILKP